MNFNLHVWAQVDGNCRRWGDQEWGNYFLAFFRKFRIQLSLSLLWLAVVVYAVDLSGDLYLPVAHLEHIM